MGIVATVWLALTGQLGLYIHPRYFTFTVIMAIIAVVFVLLAFAIVPATQFHTAQAHNDDDDHTGHERPRGYKWWAAVSVVLVGLTAVALLVLPPATLTTATVEQRDMNGSVVAGTMPSDTVSLAGGDDSSFTVKDWAGLLRQGADSDFLSGRTPVVVGFVTPDIDDPKNVFYVARFVITCCAVDAQPIGVPVYLPDWQDQLKTDAWVSVTGIFIENPSIDSMQATVLTPHEVTPTEQPAQPYVY